MLFTKIKKNLKEILVNKPKIIIGLSGGPDSLFLLLFLKELEKENLITLLAAHLDHGWRKESEKDIIFCQDLCKKLDINFVSEHAKNIDLNLKFNGSKEEIGRLLRRAFFQDLLKKEKADYIALAHHLQDQQETFLYRIIRGATLSGLTCMKKIDHPYIRPILNISKQEILDYLDQNNIKYLIDHTNDSDNFLRNRIRKYVIPALAKCDDRFDLKFQTTIQSLQEEELFLKRLTEEYFNNIFKIKDNEYTGKLDLLLKLDKVLQKRIIIYWLIQEKVEFNLSEKYLEEILRFLNNKSGGSHKTGNNWQVIKKQRNFYIKK